MSLLCFGLHHSLSEAYVLVDVNRDRYRAQRKGDGKMKNSKVRLFSSRVDWTREALHNHYTKKISTQAINSFNISCSTNTDRRSKIR